MDELVHTDLRRLHRFFAGKEFVAFRFYLDTRVISSLDVEHLADQIRHGGAVLDVRMPLYEAVGFELLTSEHFCDGVRLDAVLEHDGNRLGQRVQQTRD